MAMKIQKQSRKLIKPSIPTPPNLHHYKISFMDELVPAMNVSIVLFFSINGGNSPKLVSHLENSLEKTLTRFYPLAGRYVQQTHTVDCNDQGAEFIHAGVDIKLQDFLDSEMDVKMVDEFIPKHVTDADRAAEPMCAAQVTVFQCGGLALGVSIAHRIADASTLSTFITEWARMNRDDQNEVKFTGLGFNTSSMFPARGLPCVEFGTCESTIVTKKLPFSESVISKMKAKRIGSHRQSKVQLVSALIWKALIDVDLARNGYRRDSIIIQPINLRGRTASSIPKSSCGNLCGLLAAECTSGEAAEWVKMVDLLTQSVEKTKVKFSKIRHDSEEGQKVVLNSMLCPWTNVNPETALVVWVSSWCKFPFYEVDFGFGRPVWANCGSVPSKNVVCLMDDAGGNAVEVCVGLEVEDVPYFEQALDMKAFGA